MLLFKLNSAGSLEWAKTLGTTANDYSFNMEPVPSGGYVVSGESDGYGAGNRDFVLLTLN